jgi:hypothetical protein
MQKLQLPNLEMALLDENQRKLLVPSVLIASTLHREHYERLTRLLPAPVEEDNLVNRISRAITPTQFDVTQMVVPYTPIFAEKIPQLIETLQTVPQTAVANIAQIAQTVEVAIQTNPHIMNATDLIQSTGSLFVEHPLLAIPTYAVITGVGIKTVKDVVNRSETKRQWDPVRIDLHNAHTQLDVQNSSIYVPALMDAVPKLVNSIARGWDVLQSNYQAAELAFTNGLQNLVEPVSTFLYTNPQIHQISEILGNAGQFVYENPLLVAGGALTALSVSSVVSNTVQNINNPNVSQALSRRDALKLGGLALLWTTLACGGGANLPSADEYAAAPTVEPSLLEEEDEFPVDYSNIDYAFPTFTIGALGENFYKLNIGRNHKSGIPQGYRIDGKSEMAGTIMQAATKYKPNEIPGRPMHLQQANPIPHPDVEIMDDLQLYSAEKKYAEFVKNYNAVTEIMHDEDPQEFAEWFNSPSTFGMRGTNEVVNDYYRIREEIERRNTGRSELELIPITSERELNSDLLKYQWQQIRQWGRDVAELGFLVAVPPAIGGGYMFISGLAHYSPISDRELDDTSASIYMLMGTLMTYVGWNQMMTEAFTLPTTATANGMTATYVSMDQGKALLDAGKAVEFSKPNSPLMVVDSQKFATGMADDFANAINYARANGGKVVLDLAGGDTKYVTAAMRNGTIPRNSVVIASDLKAKHLLTSIDDAVRAAAETDSVFIALQSDAQAMPANLYGQIDHLTIIAPWDDLGYQLYGASQGNVVPTIKSLLSPTGQAEVVVNNSAFTYVLNNGGFSLTAEGGGPITHASLAPQLASQYVPVFERAGLSLVDDSMQLLTAKQCSQFESYWMLRTADSTGIAARYSGTGAIRFLFEATLP